MGLIPGLGKSTVVGNDNPLQYSCLENSMDRGAWKAAVHGSQRAGHHWATEHTHTCIYFLFIHPEGSLTLFFDLTMVYLLIPLFRDSWIVSQIFVWKHCCSECSCSCLLCTQASISLGCSPGSEKAALGIRLPTAFLDIVNLFSKAGASVGAFPISSI